MSVLALRLVCSRVVFAAILCTKLVGRASWSDSLQPPLLCTSNGITGVFYRASSLYLGSEDLNSGLRAFMTNQLALSPLASTNFHS